MANGIDMNNPFLQGLIGIMGAQNPEQFAQMMASQGVGPDSIGQGGGSLGALLASQPAAQASFPAGTSAPAQAPAGAAAAQASPAGVPDLRGVKAPGAIDPVFRAGVSGAQGAPTASVVQGGSAVSDQMLQLLLSGQNQNPLRVPGLGQLIGG